MCITARALGTDPGALAVFYIFFGHIGDGKIFVYDVRRVVKVRTGEEDFAALQDVE